MENFLKQIRENWLVLGFLISVVMTWTTINTRLAAAEQKITDLQILVSQINSINLNIAVIQEKITNINDKLKIK